MSLWDDIVLPRLRNSDLAVGDLLELSRACASRALDKCSASLRGYLDDPSIELLMETSKASCTLTPDDEQSRQLEEMALRLDMLLPDPDSALEAVDAYNYSILCVRYLARAVARQDRGLAVECPHAGYQAIVGDLVKERAVSAGTEHEYVEVEEGIPECQVEIAWQMQRLDERLDGVAKS